MKKLWIGLSAAVLVVSLCVTGALAAGRHSRWNTGAGGVSGCSAVCFTNADGDGVCDNFGTGLDIRQGCGQHGGCRNH